jgi:hypothetical protein
MMLGDGAAFEELQGNHGRATLVPAPDDPEARQAFEAAIC